MSKQAKKNKYFHFVLYFIVLALAVATIFLPNDYGQSIEIIKLVSELLM